MPIYEYKCKKCGKIFDVLQKINSDPVKKCIHCEGTVEKLISSSSFQFKGGGWYVTDYKKSVQDKDDNKTPVSPEKDPGKEKKEEQKNVA